MGGRSRKGASVQNGHDMDGAEDRRIISYQYGGTARLWPGEAEVVLDQMADFWDKLLEIEQRHRSAVDAVASDDEQVAMLDVALGEVSQEVGKLLSWRTRLRKLRRSRPEAETEEVEELLREAITKRTDLRLRRKDAAKQAREAARGHLLVLRKQRIAEIAAERKAAAATGLYWGNYNEVLRRFETAAFRARKAGGNLGPARRDSHGTFAVQVVPPVPVSRFLRGGSGWDVGVFPPSQLEGPVSRDPAAWLRPYDDRKGKPRGLFGMTIVGARGTGGPPVQAVIDIAYHRPLPHEAEVAYVRLTRKRAGGRWAHFVTVLCRLPLSVCSVTGQAVGIAVGHRRVDGGLRVAVAAWEDGRTDALVYPDELLARHDRIAESQGLLDKAADGMWRRLLGEGTAFADAPEPLSVVWEAEQERRPGGGRRTHKGLLRLLKVWPCGWRDDLRDELSSWADRRKRALDRLSRFRLRTSRWGRELRRIWVASLLQQARRVVLDELPTQPKTRNSPDETGTLTEDQRRMAAIASPRALSDWIVSQSESRGVTVVRCAYSPNWRCRSCGFVWKTALPSDVVDRCIRCGTPWDRDVNAARNLLEVGLNAPVPS